MFNILIATTDQEREDAFFVRRKVFVEEQGVPLNLELDELDKTAEHFIVYNENQPMGAGRFREVSSGIGKVERVCILPHYRRKKVGMQIMTELEDYAKSKEFKKILLNAQSYAVPFYQKMGYEVTSPEFMDADIPHRAMQKIIKT